MIDKEEEEGKIKRLEKKKEKQIVVEKGRIKGVVKNRGKIEEDNVIICERIWGSMIEEMVGEEMKVMKIENKIKLLGKYKELEGKGKEIGWKIMRDKGN